MSRSCHSATSSTPTWRCRAAPGRGPRCRSHTIGLRLCGIAEEPFWPAANGSLGLAHLGALQVAHLQAKRSRRRRPAIAAQQCGVAVARRRPGWRRPRARGRARPARRLDSRVDDRVRADRARELAHRTPSNAAAGARAGGALGHPAQQLEPKVVGSAWTPWVRPIIGVCRCPRLGAGHAAPATVDAPPAISSPASRSCSARAVSTTSDEVRP